MAPSQTSLSVTTLTQDLWVVQSGTGSLPGRRHVDPETLETEQALDEVFENIVLIDRDSTSPDDDWMPGEFDIA